MGKPFSSRRRFAFCRGSFQGCIARGELRMMHREEALSAEGLHRLAEVLGEHVDAAPVLLVVLPVLEDGQIQLGNCFPISA